MIRRVLTLALGLGLTAADCAALAAPNEYLCCNLSAGSSNAPCVAQVGACTPSAPYSVSLWQLAGGADAGANLLPGATSVVFPDGIDGYVYWVASPPWVGYCLDSTPTATDPLGCFALTLSPSVGAAGANLWVPDDPKWSAYQRCYGPPDSTGSCALVADLLDPTVTLTPSGSCCSLPVPFEGQSVNGEWALSFGQENPGVPPPILTYDPNGVILPFREDVTDPMPVDTYGPLPDACLPQYLESTTCGQPPDSAATAQPLGLVADASAAAMQAAAGGGCSMGGEMRAGGWALLISLVLTILKRCKGECR